MRKKIEFTNFKGNIQNDQVYIYITQESEGGGHVLRKMKSTTYPGS